MKAQHLLLCLPLALVGCSTQYMQHPSGMKVLNNNLMNKKSAERFAFEFDPQTGKVEFKSTSINMDNTDVPLAAATAWGLTKYYDAEVAKKASDNGLQATRAKEATRQVETLAAPTVIDPAVQKASRGAEVMAPVIP